MRSQALTDAIETCRIRIRDERNAIAKLAALGQTDMSFDMSFALSELQHQSELLERLLARK